LNWHSSAAGKHISSGNYNFLQQLTQPISLHPKILGLPEPDSKTMPINCTPPLFQAEFINIYNSIQMRTKDCTVCVGWNKEQSSRINLAPPTPQLKKLKKGQIESLLSEGNQLWPEIKRTKMKFPFSSLNFNRFG